MSDWVEVGLPPGESSAMLMAGMLRETGTPTDERQGAGFGTHDPLSAVPGEALVPESSLVQTHRLPEDTTNLGSW